MTYRGRFAPSPSGQLHLGSLLAAVGSWLRARAHGGCWIIRIEDIDPPREVAGASEDIIATLARCGLESDEAIVQQSDRRELYRAALQSLIDAGHAYPCACTRQDLQAFGGIHPTTCVRKIAPQLASAWRMRVPDKALEFVDQRMGRQVQHLRSDVGDFIVQRSDGWPAYQLAVVVDDAEQAISEVVRGADLLDSTPRQILLQQQLNLPTPTYLHLPLVLGADGRKLSKQDQALPVDGNDPFPAMAEVLQRLGLPKLRATTPAALLQQALEHPDFADTAIACK